MITSAITSRRRSQRLILAVPIIVSAESVTGHFNEETRTLVVNAHGALITLAATVAARQRVTIKHRATGEEQACRVVYVEPSPKDEGKVGVEFVKPSSHFWHIAFPPADWSPDPVASQGESSVPLSAESSASQAPERRRTTRYNFGAIAEIADLGSRKELVGLTRDLSLTGCFVKTGASLPQGTEVHLKIKFSGTEFAARGRVTRKSTSEGMGIEFVQIQAKDQAIIEGWLSLTVGPEEASFSKPRRQERLIRGIPVTVSGQLPTGAFSEDTETQIVMSDGALLHLEAKVLAGQVVRVKNRLTRMEQDCRVLFVDPKIEPGKPKLLAVEFLGPVHNFWRIEPE